MSNYYLCDRCAREYPAYIDGDEIPDMCYCAFRGETNARLRQKRVMYDHHGRDGKRYDEPLDVCADFKRRDA